MLHVGRIENRPFDDDDTELLQVVADRVAAAIQTPALRDRTGSDPAARTQLAAVDDCRSARASTFAARYVPAEDRTVGGDWYDLFVLPSGQLWIVVGDVAGHGLQAAVVMGRIRSALRAYALLETSPAHVLDLVERKVKQFEIGTFATIVCAVTSPPYDTMTIAIAGHPPPVVAAPGEPATYPKVEVSPPIGAPTNRGAALDDDHARARHRRRVLHRRPHRAAR